MLLTQNQFDQKFKDNKLRLAFIGMSNIGKSFRAQELKKEKNFSYISIDDGINKELNFKTEEDTAKWLGFPYKNTFKERQKKYLQLEDLLTRNINIPQNNNFIADTTGSAIYLSNETHKFLKDNFLIIHFEIPQNLLNAMIEKYFSRPKPIIWGNICNKQENETDEETLKRCYPKLLDFRTKKYQALADISIDCFRKNPMSHQDFWEVLRGSLK